jgi:hypothetical protein
MPDEENSQSAAGPEIFRSSVEQAIDILSGLLLKRASDKGGGLTAPDIRDVIDGFKDQPNPILDSLFAASWKKCLAVAESAHWSTARKFHFERVMVKCFSALLPNNNETIESGRHLSRRIIPGFIHAVQQMMGPEVYTQYGDRTKSLVDTLRAVHGETFSWSEVYADASCQAVVEEVLVSISHHFSDMAKRRNWMIDVVDAHMPATANEAEKLWNFGDGAFHTLMNAMYGDLRAQCQDAQWHDILQTRHGPEKVGELEEMLNGLQSDHADLLQAGRL